MKKSNYILSDKISVWLWSCVLLLITTILAGGITRLTNSGLSITEWKPFIGIIPPLNSETWLLEFKKYQQTPEYNLINFGMNLSEFKKIYLMEYLHRVLARIMGFIFLIPFIWFTYKKNLSRKETIILVITFIFGIMQAFAGWFMVKSGLISMPHVSHFRLSIHLIIAVIIISLLLIVIFGRCAKTNFIEKKFLFPLTSLQLLVFIQIIMGSLLAGLDGGLIYNEFPLMGDSFIPDEVKLITFLESFSSPAIVQFMHRLVAYIIILNTCCVFFIYKTNIVTKAKLIFKILFFIVLLQIIIGIITLLLHVPAFYASLHQGIGILLHCIILYLNYSCYKNKSGS